MSNVYRGIGSQVARMKELGPVLDEVADVVEKAILFVAAEHIDTTDYAHSIEVTVDRSSPSGQDRYVGPTDPDSVAIEFGYTDRGHKPHDGQHVVERAYNLIPRV
jgi:hypothetical protein